VAVFGAVEENQVVQIPMHQGTPIGIDPSSTRTVACVTRVR
jgi:hypothetical protein